MLNATLIRTFWLQRLRSPMRMSFLALILAGTAVFAAFGAYTSLSQGVGSLMVTLVFCIGMISQDISSGTAHLIFARPVPRLEYLLSRMTAVAAAAAVAYLAQVAIICVFIVARGGTVGPRELMLVVTDDFLAIVGVTATFGLLSSIARGLGDVGLFVLLEFARILGDFAAKRLTRDAWTSQFGAWLGWLLDTDTGLRGLLMGGPFPWAELLRYGVIATACFITARIAIERRELSYA